MYIKFGFISWTCFLDGIQIPPFLHAEVEPLHNYTLCYVKICSGMEGYTKCTFLMSDYAHFVILCTLYVSNSTVLSLCGWFVFHYVIFLCNEYPLIPHFYVLKIGLQGSTFFLFCSETYIVWTLVEAVLMNTHNQFFLSKIFSKIIIF